MKDQQWIGVDLDGVLAYQGEEIEDNEIGEPIEPMVKKVKTMIDEGKLVKIFTARAVDPYQKKVIQNWLEEQGLPRLEVTNKKDHNLIRFYDDKAIQVKKNKGELVG